MSHLTPAEVIDLLEGTLAEARRAHASECPQCCREAAEAARAIEAARDAGVPEPSPLYWEHFSRRVHDAIHEQPARDGWRGLIEWRAALGALAAVMLIAIGTALSWRANVTVPTAPGASPVPTAAQTGAVQAPQTVSQASDDDWEVVAGLADGMEWDAAREAGLAVKPGAAEHAVLQLSDEQRDELARMLQAEIARSKS